MTNGTILIVCQIKNQTEKKQKTSDQQVKKLMRQVTCRSEKTPHQCDKPDFCKQAEFLLISVVKLIL